MSENDWLSHDWTDPANSLGAEWWTEEASEAFYHGLEWRSELNVRAVKALLEAELEGIKAELARCAVADVGRPSNVKDVYWGLLRERFKKYHTYIHEADGQLAFLAERRDERRAAAQKRAEERRLKRAEERRLKRAGEKQ